MEQRGRTRSVSFLVMLAGSLSSSCWASSGEAVQARLDSDVAAGMPIVVHVVVALCDNVHQGIAPVPKHLGNGQDPRKNLYWGALYGVRTYLSRDSGWVTLGCDVPSDRRILDRIMVYAVIERRGSSVPVYIVADAWDGAHIEQALRSYFDTLEDDSAEIVIATHGSERLEIRAGGASHLAASVGHNGLMDFSLPLPKTTGSPSFRKSAVVLACASKPYFAEPLREAGVHALLLTWSFMAPEAYTLDAVIRAWVAGGSTPQVIEAAATAYDRYQKCGLKAARSLFWGAP
ncbi:MAG: hypothetical protein JSV80_06375 [Acidobacteriota bacterium]|nr:MAG: hypothetical protein JSV80_06375 [Acidobacteriota bacterium]